MCIDFRKLNANTRKDHFPIPFIDEMLERLAGKSFFYFLDGFSSYYQIVVAQEEQEKTTIIVHSELLITEICLLDCVMPQVRFKDV